MVRIFVFFVFVVPAGLKFPSVFSLCLDDEAKHFALSLQVPEA